MNERIQRNGLKKDIQLGTTVRTLEGYDVYDQSMHFIVASVFGLEEAQAALERDTRMSKMQCSTGGCED